MTLRNLTTNELIYDQKYIPQNSTSFVVPRSVLSYGNEYRWCLRAHDNAGGAKCSDYPQFKIENYISTNAGGGVTVSANDAHI